MERIRNEGANSPAEVFIRGCKLTNIKRLKSKFESAPGLRSTTFFQQISNRAVSQPGFGRQPDFAGAVGRNAAGAVGGEFGVDFTQGVLIQFRHDETAVAGEAAAGDAGRFEDLLNASGEQLPQLAFRACFSGAAVDVQRNRPGLLVDHQARQ